MDKKHSLIALVILVILFGLFVFGGPKVSISNETLTANPAAGEYYTPQSVELSYTPGSSIYYKTITEGMVEPDPSCSGSGRLYSKPITVSGSLSIQAIGCDPGGGDSGVVSFNYVITDKPSSPEADPTPEVVTPEVNLSEPSRTSSGSYRKDRDVVGSRTSSDSSGPLLAKAVTPPPVEAVIESQPAHGLISATVDSATSLADSRTQMKVAELLAQLKKLVEQLNELQRLQNSR